MAARTIIRCTLRARSVPDLFDMAKRQLTALKMQCGAYGKGDAEDDVVYDGVTEWYTQTWVFTMEIETPVLR